MVKIQRFFTLSWLYKRFFWYCLIIAIFIGFVRSNKGSIILDLYSFIPQPFSNISDKQDRIESSDEIEKNIRISLLEKDNKRLREILELQSLSKKDRISAAVILREPRGWWQKLELNKGLKHGVMAGDAVVAPGGLVGLIYSATPYTSRVRLLTSSGSQIGVWVERTKNHGIMTGMGTINTKLSFLDSEIDVQKGDVVVTSPSSTLLPANLPIGIIQSVNRQASPTPDAIVQLIASPSSIDWVQILQIR